MGTIEQVGIAPLLQAMDWVVIGIFFFMVIGIGLMAARTAGKDTSEFFLGGRGMPWWLLGGSMVLIPVAVQCRAVWYPGAEPGGGGYIAQRMLAAKDEKNAIGAMVVLFRSFGKLGAE